ncbi:lycopene cyclase family protein [Delftia acidovorans]|uniref:FAD-dependent monooxygenase n=1 Tax=Delftia acidovorans TaxID=80866 RepID=UPI0005006C69|nr:FAD-dependent monooxygenase [Delftia acidovorans]KFJ11186.1 lycopene cyclase family protein [Delftia acidovorans]QQB52850.1 FAD-dependent monooxygenase [Delftia acidovorans]
MSSHAMAAAPLPDELDVLVVGAGPAGAAVAAQLAGHCRVALIGRAVQAGRAIGETLPAAARVILSDLGVWDAFAAQGHRPAWSRRSLWGSSEVIFQDALFDPHGAGWHLDRARFDAMLLEAARSRGVPCLVPATLRSMQRQPPGAPMRWRCLIDRAQGDTAHGPLELSCRIVVDATGRAARVARQAGAQVHRGGRLVCFHAWVEPPSHEHAGTTMIESDAEGWWYSADLPDGSCVIAWQTDIDLPEARRLLSTADLLEMAHHTALVGARSRGSRVLEPLRVAAAHEQWLDAASGPDWLAVGDAGLSFDPLASQGLLNSLVTGSEAALAVRRSLAGDADALPSWNAWIGTIRAAYRTHHQHYYALEQRWAAEPFWTRRQQAPEAGIGADVTAAPTSPSARSHSSAGTRPA